MKIKYFSKIMINGLNRESSAVLLHTIGFDDCGNGKPYRNYFAAEKGNEICKHLERLGYLKRHEFYDKHLEPKGQEWYVATSKGKYAALKAVSFVRTYMNCTMCSMISVNDKQNCFECMKAVDLGRKRRFLKPDELWRSKRCYDGIFNVRGWDEN